VKTGKNDHDRVVQKY